MAVTPRPVLETSKAQVSKKTAKHSASLRAFVFIRLFWTKRQMIKQKNTRRKVDITDKEDQQRIELKKTNRTNIISTNFI